MYAAAFFNGRFKAGASQSDAVAETKDFVRAALRLVQQQPYWARRGGSDHVFVFAQDFGRCNLAPPEVGPAIAIQINGDPLPGDGALRVSRLAAEPDLLRVVASVLVPLRFYSSRRCTLPQACSDYSCTTSTTAWTGPMVLSNREQLERLPSRLGSSLMQRAAVASGGECSRAGSSGLRPAVAASGPQGRPSGLGRWS